MLLLHLDFLGRRGDNWHRLHLKDQSTFPCRVSQDHTRVQNLKPREFPIRTIIGYDIVSELSILGRPCRKRIKFNVERVYFCIV